MQRAKLCLAAACILSTATSRLAAQGFNGVIQFASYEDHPNRPDTMTQMTKGSKIRFEGMGMHGGALIMNGTDRIVLIPEQKAYMALPASFGADQAEKHASKHHGSAAKTGKTETVAGIPCEVWHYEGKNNDGKPEVGDACVAKGAGLMVNRLAGGISGDYFDAGGEAFAEEMRKGSGLLKVTANGKVQFEAIRAQASTVPDAMFAPPPDYKPMTMPGMGTPRKP